MQNFAVETTTKKGTGTADELSFATWIETYKPIPNPAGLDVEGFDGIFISETGVSGDWVKYQNIENVWSITAENNFELLTCSSGCYEGLNVVGYFVCETPYLSDKEARFVLPEDYSSIESILLHKDESTDRWRPARYELKGDRSRNCTPVVALSEAESKFPMRSQIRAYELNRRREQYAVAISATEDEVAELANKIDHRYLLAEKLPAWGHDPGFVFTEVYTLEYFLSNFAYEDIGLISLSTRIPERERPEGDAYLYELYENVGGHEPTCELNDGDPASETEDAYSDDECSCVYDSETSGMGAFDHRVGLTGFQFNLRLDAPIVLEETFRDTALK